MLRTLRACGVSARMLNAVLVTELVSLALVAGVIGLVCGYFIAASLLPDVAASLRGLYGAQIPGELTLKPEWWVAGLGHQRRRRAAGGNRQSDEGDPASGAGGGATPCLATGAASMAAAAGRTGAYGARRHGPAAVVRRFSCRRICRARGPAAWRGAGPAVNSRTCVCHWDSAAPAARSRSGSGPTAGSSSLDCRWR